MFTDIGLPMFLVSFYMKAEATSMKLISTFIKKFSADLRIAFSKCFGAEWELASCDSVEKFLYVLGLIVKGIFNCSRKYMFIMGEKRNKLKAVWFSTSLKLVNWTVIGGFHTQDKKIIKFLYEK